jgi:hypothetical protein
MIQNRNRILFESQIMRRDLPQFKLYWNRDDDIYFQGWHKALINGIQYQLKLILSPYYPHEKPILYVTFPLTLWKFGGGTINSLDTSHSFHTFGNGPDGCVQICHFPPGTWDASKTCIGIFYKGILWIESYAVHLLTGMDIADILEEWRKRQSRMKKTEWSKFSWIPSNGRGSDKYQELMTLNIPRKYA